MDRDSKEVRDPGDAAPLPAPPGPDAPTIVIEPRPGWKPVDFAELWLYRELMWFLAQRDFRVRYKQTFLGVAWAVLQPLTTMVVFTLLFGVLMGRGNQPSPDGIPYAVSTFCALVPWQLFAFSLTQAGNSLVANERLVTKVYFPRLLIPTATVTVGLVDFVLAFIVLLAMMAFYGIVPSGSIVVLPVFVLLAMVTALAMALWLSAANALYRDIKYTIPFLTQFLMYMTPVVYPAESILPKMPQWAQVIYSLNPMFCVVEGFRWVLLDSAPPPLHLLVLSGAMVGVLLVGGMLYFRRLERVFADFL